MRSPGKVADVGKSRDRQQVVLAEGVKADPARDDQLVVALAVGEGGDVERARGQQFGIRGSHPPRSLAQMLIGDVLAERDEQLADRPSCCLLVNLPRLTLSSAGAVELECRTHRRSNGRRSKADASRKRATAARKSPKSRSATS